ncbi:MAG: two pore domain potassium channel family protein [gamma proteobacterium endosymbiont of Lamellibrachia anaximandri]|nr:two pore domain potassium channel family protein [gamma proteobacterium endosymbiont of Lamellibrachia anaximandri]MBL3619076.1 two pore domain potassium channel family protein [gamma proteobacterium endosymbiont of Lamellibrachia anaximandri]
METTLLFLQIFSQALFYTTPILLFLVTLILLSAAVIARQEPLPINHAIYMSFITAMTIGYGDFTPKKPLSRLLAILLGIIGVIFTGIIVAAAVYATQQALHATLGR